MKPQMLLFYLIGLFYGNTAQASHLHKSIYLTVTKGSNLSLQCPQEKQVYKYYWYKQSLGELPILVSNIYLGANNGVLEDDFRLQNRFSLGIEKDRNHLNITDLRLSDSATYFCITSSSMNFHFVQSVTVLVKSHEFEVRQSLLGDVELGKSVVLQCSVHIWSCEDQHSVHWFKRSGGSDVGRLYSHGGGEGDGCKKNPDAPAKSCIYSFPIHNVSSEQMGIYYCAVAACGQVLFGDGTKLSVEAAPEMLYILGGALMFTSSLLLAVTFCLCSKNTSEPFNRHSSSSTKAKGFPKMVQYTAVDHVSRGSRRQMEETWSECIYFSFDELK